MCGIIGMLNKDGKRIDGSSIKKGLSLMNERGNGQGAGYAAYGIYPEFKDHYALHVFLDNMKEAKFNVEQEIERWGYIVYSEEIPTTDKGIFEDEKIPYRYFFKPDPRKLLGRDYNEKDAIVEMVMRINSQKNGALVFSSGKNMGIFKASGWPNDVAEFYKINQYKGYMWLGHNRYPTNTPGWWGGAHPFGLLDWGVVHNGEITSYGTNKRYVESFGYNCSMLTDTEVVTYLFDLLVRKHKLPLRLAGMALAPMFWKDIERMPEQKRQLHAALRLTYSSAAMNGPFAIVVANTDGFVALTDRIKLRPLVIGKKGKAVYVSSEEAAIRAMEPLLDSIYSPPTGDPIVHQLEVQTL
ncbi:MAG: class II glutamine amidotransferase [Candidatus Methanofastidiosia archaeon]